MNRCRDEEVLYCILVGASLSSVTSQLSAPELATIIASGKKVAQVET